MAAKRSPAPSTPSTESILSTSLASQALAAKARAALKKQVLGKELTNAEIAAVRKYEQQRDAERRAEAYARCTPGDLCALLGAGREQLRRWVSYGLPRNEDGSYNLGTFLPRLLDHERERLKAAAAPAISALEQMRLLDAAHKQRQAAVERGELGPVAIYEAEAEALTAQERIELDGWLNGLPPMLANKDAREIHALLRAEGRKLKARWSGLRGLGAGRKGPGG